jgi:hypothetical protein
MPFKTVPIPKPKKRTAKPDPRPKRKDIESGKERQPREDMNQTAYRVMQEVIARSEESAAPVVAIHTRQPVSQKNPAAVALGRLGGLKGGKARAEKLGAERLRQSASKAARARWAKRPQP